MRKPTRCSAEGFSLIELLVSMGIILMLLGLFLPSLANARKSGRSIQAVAVFASNRRIVATYQTDFAEYFPLSKQGDGVASKTINYYGPLLFKGYIKRIEDIDPWFTERGFTSTQMTYAAFMDFSLMVPGATRPMSLVPVVAQNAAKIVNPSGKGLLLMSPVIADKNGGSGSWCCYPGAPKSPIAFDDGSAGEFYWAELLPDGKLYVENEIGTPVSKTWFGLRGSDRK